jgi:hypothetical protein
MKIYEAENKQYISLGDLDHMLRCMRRKIYDKYVRDDEGKFYQEDGTFGLTHDDSIEVSMLAHVMSGVLENKIHACETPDEIRELHKRIEDEFYMDKYVLTMTQENEDGKKELYFFRNFCLGAMEARLKEDGKTDEEIAKETEDACGDPVFSPRRIDAMFFEDHESADSSATFIRHNYNCDVRIDPAWYYNPNVKDRLEKWLSEEDEQNG